MDENRLRARLRWLSRRTDRIVLPVDGQGARDRRWDRKDVGEDTCD